MRASLFCVAYRQTEGKVAQALHESNDRHAAEMQQLLQEHKCVCRIPSSLEYPAESVLRLSLAVWKSSSPLSSAERLFWWLLFVASAGTPSRAWRSARART
jgi:hypothetical protein